MMADSQHDQQLQRSLSTSSIDSVLPPPLQHKRRVLFLLSVLSVTTVVMLVVCCIYTDIVGRGSYWYSKPDSWQFCVVYADQTVQLWKKSLTDSTATQLSYLGLMNLLYTWGALASTFRSLFHFEWIPSTVAFLGFILFGQLAYFQSTNLITVPSKLPSTLLSVTQWMSWDMYDHLGTFCTDSFYSLAGFSEGNLFPREERNCTDEFIIINPKVQDALGDQILQIKLLTNSSVANGDNNCGGAVNLHIVFLTCCWVLVGITFSLLVVLCLADREIRANRPQRHFFKETGEDLKGDKACIFNVLWATVGYVMTSCANLQASFVALKNVRDYHLIDSNTGIVKQVPLGKVVLDLDLNYYLNSWLPFKTNQLNLQTVLLIITTMSVLRGHFKQSISAFRLSAVTSLLSVIIMWPTIVGTLETMKDNHLWWWDDYETCVEFHSGLPFLNANRAGSAHFCDDTRWGVAGALLTFVALHLNIASSLYVYTKNQTRESLIVLSEPGLGDPFTFDYADDNDAEYNPAHEQGNGEKPPKAANTPTPM